MDAARKPKLGDRLLMSDAMFIAESLVAFDVFIKVGSGTMADMTAVNYVKRQRRLDVSIETHGSGDEGCEGKVVGQGWQK